MPNPYAWKWYGYHISNSSDPERLHARLTDFTWLHAKLKATDVANLLGEFRHEDSTKTESLRLIESAIRLSANVLIEDKTQLASQLLGRLQRASSIDIDSVRSKASTYEEFTWFEPLTSSLQTAGGTLVRTLEGHSELVNAVAITPDGRNAVSGAGDNTLKVWDLETGESVRTLEGHSGGVNAVAIAPDGRHAVSGWWDNTLKVWDLETGENVRTLEGHSNFVNAVAVTPDGRYVVSGSADRRVKLWELETCQLITSFFGDWPINTVCVAGSGIIIAGDWSGRLHFLKIRLREENQ